MRVLDVQVDAYLTGFARDYNYNTDEKFVADIIAPKKQVAASTYLYKYYGQEALLTHVDDTKAPKGGANEVDFDVSEASGVITTRSLKIFVDDESIQQSVDPVAPMEDATAFLVKALNLRREIRLATLAAATSNATAPTYDWDNASATPLSDIATYKATMRTNLGAYPTHLVAHPQIWDELAISTGLTGIYKYQPFLNALEATGEKLASQKLLGVIPVSAGAVKNSADEGATVTVANVWADDAYLVHVDSNARGVPWAIQPYVNDHVVTRWRDDDRGGWWVKVEHKIGLKEVTTAAIYEMTDVT